MPKDTSERHFQMLFEYAPISLWEQDFSAIKTFFDDLRKQDIHDLDGYLDKHPEQIEACIARMQVVDVNQQTLVMFGVRTKEEMIANLDNFSAMRCASTSAMNYLRSGPDV
jgi:hypothetical protein